MAMRMFNIIHLLMEYTHIDPFCANHSQPPKGKNISFCHCTNILQGGHGTCIWSATSLLSYHCKSILAMGPKDHLGHPHDKRVDSQHDS